MVKKIKNNDFSEVEASKIAIVNFSVTATPSFFHIYLQSADNKNIHIQMH